MFSGFSSSFELKSALDRGKRLFWTSRYKAQYERLVHLFSTDLWTGQFVCKGFCHIHFRSPPILYQSKASSHSLKWQSLPFESVVLLFSLKCFPRDFISIFRSILSSFLTYSLFIVVLWSGSCGIFTLHPGSLFPLCLLSFVHDGRFCQLIDVKTSKRNIELAFMKSQARTRPLICSSAVSGSTAWVPNFLWTKLLVPRSLLVLWTFPIHYFLFHAVHSSAATRIIIFANLAIKLCLDNISIGRECISTFFRSGRNTYSTCLWIQVASCTTLTAKRFVMKFTIKIWYLSSAQSTRWFQSNLMPMVKPISVSIIGAWSKISYWCRLCFINGTWTILIA